MSDGSESLASTVCRARRAALDGRVIKVKLAGEVQCYILEAVGDAMAATRAIRQLIQGGFDLTDADTVAMKCKYLDDEGDLCTLNKLTLAHWVQQHPNGPLKIQVSVATLDEAARHIEREAGKQDAKAPNDVDSDDGKSMGTVIRGIDYHDAPKQSAIEVVDWTRAAYGRCPRHRKHTRRRDPTGVDQSANFAGTTTGQTRHSPTTMRPRSWYQ